MNFNKLTCSKKNILIVSILVISLASLVVIPAVHAAHPAGNDSVTKIITAAANEIFYRDILNNNKQVDADGNSLSTVEKNVFFTGEVIALSVKITDEDANLDASALDVILSSATTTTSGLEETEFELTETGVDSGMFTAQLILSSSTGVGKLQYQNNDDISILYDPEPWGVGRFFADFSGITSSPEVTLTDVIIDKKFPCNQLDIVTHPVQLSITPGTGTIDDATVSINFANRWQVSDFGVLKVLYRADENAHFESLGGKVVPPDPPTVFNIIQSTVSPANVEGQYALGFDSGCSGGGGGGLVRPGLVVNVLAGSGAISSIIGSLGGGGGGTAVPLITGSSLFLEPEAGITLLGEGISSSGESLQVNLDDSSGPVAIQTGEATTFSFDIYENQGIHNLEHATMYFFIGEDADVNTIHNDVSKSDTYILFDTGQSIHVIDPHGYFENASFDVSEIDPWNLQIKYDITFAKPMETSSLLIRTWDHDKNTSDKVILNAIEVVEPSFFNVPVDLTSQDSTLTQTELADIPIWVKNNALWWQQKQIDDADFVAGIEYLINENLITISETQTTTAVTSDEIPDWISEVAGFWAHDAISDAEFVQSIQWLISNGVMVVT